MEEEESTRDDGHISSSAENQLDGIGASLCLARWPTEQVQRSAAQHIYPWTKPGTWTFSLSI